MTADGTAEAAAAAAAALAEARTRRVGVGEVRGWERWEEGREERRGWGWEGACKELAGGRGDTVLLRLADGARKEGMAWVTEVGWSGVVWWWCRRRWRVWQTLGHWQGRSGGGAVAMVALPAVDAMLGGRYEVWVCDGLFRTRDGKGATVPGTPDKSTSSDLGRASSAVWLPNMTACCMCS